MSSTAPANAIPASSNNKKRKQKKKPKKLTDATTRVSDGAQQPSPTSPHEDQTGDDEPDTPVTESRDADHPASPPPTSARHSTESTEALQTNGHARLSFGNGRSVTADASTATASVDDTSAKLEAMGEEREALRAEVERLRKQLETIQEAHSSEVTTLKTNVEESETARENAEEQYQTLLGRVEKIKETLGERLKRDRAELEEANIRIEELEAQNDELQKGSSSHETDVADLKNELAEANRELASLRSRNHLSQENWLKEKDDMARQVQCFRSELESTSSAMGEWEAIAMEERQMRESVAEKASDLEEQLLFLREAYDSAAEERDSSLQTVDGYKERCKKFRMQGGKSSDLVESSEEHLQEMKKRVEDADKRVSAAEAAKESLSKELERTAPFEKEVREKNLLIGKLRHEGIILNDHLTKALRYLKKTKPDEQVDRQIITNYLLQFSRSIDPTRNASKSYKSLLAT